MKKRVAIFDDSPERREGLYLLLETTDDMVCAGLFNDCRNAVADVESSKPDVILMDIDMPFVNGIEGVLKIRKVYPDLKILMQTVFEADDKIFAAICAGADGYILKQADPMKLIDAINEVLEGGAPMTPSIASKVLKLFQKQGGLSKKNSFDLTKRELEILHFLVKGYSYKMIAEECHVSYPTVNSHISKIYSKLKVQSSAGAVAIALREGLVD
ncbi:MAG TPA: response regulator transcription factor [Cryomorphaceae bacterium]|nr:response regulator transcription factor [Cryomorphaceae bacterium]